VKVLICSGYRSKDDELKALQIADLPLILKPFRPEELATQVRKALDGRLRSRITDNQEFGVSSHFGFAAGTLTYCGGEGSCKRRHHAEVVYALYRLWGGEWFLQWRPNTFLVRWLPFCLSRAYLGLLAGSITSSGDRKETRFAKPRRCGTKVPITAPLDEVVHRTFLGIYTHYFEKLITAYAPVKKVYRFVEQRITLRMNSSWQKASLSGEVSFW